MITIAQIKANDFMQYWEMQFDVSKGVYLISGRNRTGKSSVIEALLWCLYGETVRGMDTSRVLRRGAHKVSVTVSGNKDKEPFEVTRTYNGSSTTLRVVADDKIQMYGTRQLTQAWLEKYLGADFRTFSSIVLYGHNSFRFTQAKDSERKDLLEKMLPQIAMCESARLLASKNVQELNAQINDIDTQVRLLEQNIESLEAGADKHVDKEVKQLEGYIQTQKNTLARHQRTLDKLVMPEYTTKELTARRAVVNAMIRAAEQSLKALLEGESTCVVCGQTVSKEKRTALRDKYKKNIAQAETELDNIASLERITEKYDSDYRDVTDSINRSNAIIAGYEHDLEKLQSGKTGAQKVTKAEIVKNRRKISGLVEKREELIRQHAAYAFWSKGFSKSGIVSLIIDSVIDQLNEHALEVADTMTDGLFTVTFNPVTHSKGGSVQEKISMIVTVDGEESPYENLSNSERQRVDMIVMFAWHKLVSNGAVNVNVAFFDEVIEGLDEASAASVMRYIDVTRRGLATYVITHALELAALKPDGVIRVVRDKDGSHIQQ